MELSVDDLRCITLLHDLDNEEMTRFRNMAIPRMISRKQAVFHEGEQVEAIYFILHGLIKAYKTDEKGNEQIISLLKAGDMFPYTGQFDSDLYPTTCMALVDTKLLAVPIRSFELMLASTPSIAFKMMSAMGSKIRELMDKLQGFTHRSVEDRGISLLIKLAEEYGIERDGGIYVGVPMTHQEIASIIGLARESVTRLLNSLRKEGMVIVSRKGFYVKNLLALKERVCVKENCDHCRQLKLYNR
ncbi:MULTISPECIES: Crp/Fnr family transcriptional regulator [Paenibacillus]|uniref:Crp/Fnr family transcriptional regulator n=1 Tax=Paenibacillus TaxID=44249 RepID=UPI002FDF1113